MDNKNFPTNKSLGLDGFTFEFFKASWEVTGESISTEITKFFSNGKLLKASNGTWIILAHKVSNPSFMTQFRPIFCCNVIYKCITKILADKL